RNVTGVQTCALPIFAVAGRREFLGRGDRAPVLAGPTAELDGGHGGRITVGDPVALRRIPARAARARRAGRPRRPPAPAGAAPERAGPSDLAQFDHHAE